MRLVTFCDTQIKAVGFATGAAVSAQKPNLGQAGEQWDNDGWLVPVEFSEVERGVSPKDFIEELIPHMAQKYAPLQLNGNGNQGVYLAEVSEKFADKILEKLNVDVSRLAKGVSELGQAAIDDTQKALQGRTDIGATQVEQLIKARRGQGIFRVNVRLNESRCRVTGVNDLRLLVASHIKPWAKCSDEEKLDGCNGLLLSPHVDRLFDRGLMSFEDDGKILYSGLIDEKILAAWSLSDVSNVGEFSGKQAVYLKYHREEVFLR